MIASSPPFIGPLHGLTVIDLTRALSGPYCTLQLAELGARVIKVENPDGGDDTRSFPPYKDGRSIYFMSVNRNKESIALDLKDPADRPVFEQMLQTADVLVENFRPGVMARLGYDWEHLKDRYPQLVMASISGFGQDGPYRNRAAYDMVAQAMGGIMSITGHPESGPTRVGVSIGDLAAGLFATIGIQAAIHERHRTKTGSFVDIAMMDCQLSLLENAIARHLATGELPGRVGSRHPTITPFDAYQAADSYIAVCVGTQAQFVKLADIVGRPDLATDSRFFSIQSRNAHEKELKAELEAIFKTRPRNEWLALLEEHGVPGGPINDVEDLIEDSQVNARRMIVQTEDESGKMQFAAMPYKLSSMPSIRPAAAAPALDAQREKIFQELGLLQAASAS